MLSTDVGTAVLLGLAGSGHCLGMCGGIAVALRSTDNTGAWMPASYHLGRLLSYAILGGLIGSAAGAIELAGWTIFLRFLAGGLLLAMGLHTLQIWYGISHLEKLGGLLWRRIAPVAQRAIPPRRPRHSVLLGAVWGLMPCGLIYSALAWSAATGADAVDSAGLMMAFGAGTLPAMLGATLLGQRVSRALSLHWVRKGMGTLLVAAGIWTIWLTYSHLDHLLGQHSMTNHHPTIEDAHQHHSNGANP